MVLFIGGLQEIPHSVNPFYILPHHGWHFKNFVTVWKSYNYLMLYKNTLLLIFFRMAAAIMDAGIPLPKEKGEYRAYRWYLE